MDGSPNKAEQLDDSLPLLNPQDFVSVKMEVLEEMEGDKGDKDGAEDLQDIVGEKTLVGLEKADDPLGEGGEEQVGEESKDNQREMEMYFSPLFSGNVSPGTEEMLTAIMQGINADDLTRQLCQVEGKGRGQKNY